MTFPARQQPIIDHAPGERHGLVVIVDKAPTLGRGQRWLVRCDCGAERIVLGSNLRQRPPSTHRECR